MININAFIKEPLDFKGLFYIYPPSVKEVCCNKQFGTFQKLFTITQEDLDDEYLKSGNDGQAPTPFHFLMGNVYNSKDFEKIACEGLYFFTHEKFTFLPEQDLILIGDLEEQIQQVTDLKQLKFLRADDYFDFQNMIRMVMGQKDVKPPVVDSDPRIARMKRKMRERDRIKSKNASKSGTGLDLGTIIAAICCMGIGLTPLNIGEISYAAAMTLLSTYQEKEKYSLDIRSLLAGADSKKVKPKYWIRNPDE